MSVCWYHRSNPPLAWLPLRVMVSQTQAPVPQFSPDVSDERDEKSGTRFEQSLIPHQIRDPRHHQGSQQTAMDAARAHTGPQVVPPQQQVAASGVLLFDGCSLAKVGLRSLATIDVRTPARVQRPRANMVNYHRARRQMFLLKAAATMKLGGRPRLWGCQQRTGGASVSLVNQSRPKPRSSRSASSGTMARHARSTLAAVACSSLSQSPRHQQRRQIHLPDP